MLVPQATVEGEIDLNVVPLSDLERVAAQAGVAAEPSGGAVAFPVADAPIDGEVAVGTTLSDIDAAVLVSAGRSAAAATATQSEHSAPATRAGATPAISVGTNSGHQAVAASVAVTPERLLPKSAPESSPKSSPRTPATVGLLHEAVSARSTQPEGGGGAASSAVRTTGSAGATAPAGAAPVPPDGDTISFPADNQGSLTSVPAPLAASSLRADGQGASKPAQAPLAAPSVSADNQVPSKPAPVAPTAAPVSEPARASIELKIEDPAAGADRAPNTSVFGAHAAARHEHNAAPALLAAARAWAERVDAPVVETPRGDASRAQASTVTRSEGSGLVAEIVEEASRGSALLRASGDATIVPSLQMVAREAAARHRATPVSGITSGSTDDSIAPLPPGTSPQAPPTLPTSVIARIDQPRGFAALAERIVDALYLSAARGGSDIRLRIDPPGLGHIDVRVQLGDDGVRAMIVAEHEATRALLSSQQHLLEAALSRSELRLSSFSVDVSLDQGSTDFYAAEEGGEQDSSAALDDAGVEAEPTGDAARSTPLETGLLSLRV